jgi:membrane protease YdiL (CAAX protease family)
VTIAYAFSWTAWAVGYGPFDGRGAIGTACFLLGGLGPFVAALVVSWLTGTAGGFRARLFRWRVAPRWYVIALGGPVAFALGVVVLDGVLRGDGVELDAVHPIATLPVFVATGVLVGGLEEPGWRGFAQARLQRRHGALVASLAVGVAWVGWHLPLFVLPGTTQSSVPFVAFAGMGLALAVVFAWVFDGAGESAVVAVLVHGAYNGALGWSALLAAPDAGRSTSILAIALAIVALVLVVAGGPATLATGSWRQSGGTRATGKAD